MDRICCREANSGTIPRYGTSKDFYLGRAVGDAASANTTMLVALNAPRDSAYITLQKDAFDHVPVLTAGTPVASMLGGACVSSPGGLYATRHFAFS